MNANLLYRLINIAKDRVHDDFRAAQSDGCGPETCAKFRELLGAPVTEASLECFKAAGYAKDDDRDIVATADMLNARAEKRRRRIEHQPLTTQIPETIGEIASRQIPLILKAIDAIIDLEGSVYNNGLPSCMSATLQELRSKQSKFQADIDTANESRTARGEEPIPDVNGITIEVDMNKAEKKTLEMLTHAACRPHLKKRLFCKLEVNGKVAEHRVRITSRLPANAVYVERLYVQRLVKSTNRFGSKRYLVNKSDIREELV